MIEETFKTVIDNFDFTYMLIVNILTYLLIHIVDWANGAKEVSTFTKRILLIASIIIVAIGYILIGEYENPRILLNSAIAAPVLWSWVIKPLCVKYNIDYKNFVKE